MNIDSISLASPAIDRQVSSVATHPFSERLLAEANSVNSKLLNAEQELQALAAGKPVDIHHVMLSLEDAGLSFRLMSQVRNKVLDAYQDLLRMQV